MKNKRDLILFAAAVILMLITAASVQPQLSLDEQNAIVEAVVQTMNPESMKATVVAEVEEYFIAKFNAAGYVGLAGALQVPLEAETAKPEEKQLATPVPEESAEELVTEEPVSEEPGTEEEITPEEKSTETAAAGDEKAEAERPIDDIKDFPDGAVLQEDGTYRGLHAKQLNSYAYTVGENEDGQARQFHTEYTPNVRFNVDVVFENDGSVIWPARIEMRHVGNVGEYTGHTESVIVDRTYDPIKPGDKCGFTISAHGSENLGWTTFYFQLFDAVSGSPIEGGYGSFTYHAI